MTIPLTGTETITITTAGTLATILTRTGTETAPATDTGRALKVRNMQATFGAPRTAWSIGPPRLG